MLKLGRRKWPVVENMILPCLILLSSGTVVKMSPGYSGPVLLPLPLSLNTVHFFFSFDSGGFFLILFFWLPVWAGIRTWAQRLSQGLTVIADFLHFHFRLLLLADISQHSAPRAPAVVFVLQAGVLFSKEKALSTFTFDCHFLLVSLNSQFKL